MQHKLHPDFQHVYITKEKETKTKLIGTLLLYPEPNQYKAFEWYLCLINPNDPTHWVRKKWGTEDHIHHIQKLYTKPIRIESTTVTDWHKMWFNRQLPSGDG